MREHPTVAKPNCCIYCRVMLTEATHVAHVWPASMGGKLKSRKICCDECNNAISQKEHNLYEALRHTFASVGAVNDDRDPVEVSVKYEGRDFVLANGKAVLQVGSARFDHVTKRMFVPLPTELEKQAQRVAKLMRSQGLGPDDVDTLELVPGDQGPALPEGQIHDGHDLSVGGRTEHKQVFVKMAVELLAFYRHDLALRGELSEARRFARHGTGTFRCKPDIRSPGSGLLPAEDVPEIFNAIEVWTHGKSVLFRVVFLGPIVFTGTLTADWSGESFRSAYAFDARDPSRVVARALVEGGGSNLAIWIDDMRAEASVNLVSALESASLKLARTRANSKPQRKGPPDIDRLRDAVRTMLAAMPPKKPRK